jgi:predicted DNA-binding transcriptional regulator AlpA
MSETVKIVTLSADELEALIKRVVSEALAGQTNGVGAEDRLVNAEEAAGFLGYSKDWVYRHWKKIGGRKIGAKGLRFSRRDLERWAASRKIPGPS